MNSDKLKNILILTPVFALMAGAGYFLWKDYRPQQNTTEQAEENSIGTVLNLNKSVKRKPNNNLYWNSLEKQSHLFDKDFIKTGPNSTAVIRLKDSSIIEVNENSLIRLEMSSNSMTVDFKAGDISTKGQGNFSIKLKDKVLQAQGAELKLQSDGSENTEILVEKGQATLKDKNNKVINLDKSKLLRIDKKGQTEAQKLAVKLNSPIDKSTFFTNNKKIRYPFTWSVLDKSVKKQFLEISQNKKFQPKATQKFTADRAINAPISEGISYWRVGWKINNKTFYSEIRSIEIKKDERVSLDYPIDKSTFEFEPGKTDLQLSWSSTENPKLYMIEIAETPHFKNIIFTKTLAQSEFTVKDLKNGLYYWRVHAFDKKNESLGRSSYKSFYIRNILPQLPHLLAPANGINWTLNDPIIYEWRTFKEAQSYRLIVSKDIHQDRIIISQKQVNNKYIWKWKEPGNYYWQVEGLNQENKSIGKSLKYKVIINPTVLGPAIALVKPENQETIKRERKANIDPVVFSWSPQKPLLGTYDIHLSKTPDFKKPKVIKDISGRSHAEALKESANYYWKVTWQDPNNPENKEVSPTHIIKYRISSHLPAPRLVEPLHDAKKFTNSSATIDFRWDPVKSATKYRLSLNRIHPKTNEKIPVINKNIEKNTFKATQLQPGDYEWTVSCIDPELNEGLPSEKRLFRIELRRELAAPKLHQPVVK